MIYLKKFLIILSCLFLLTGCSVNSDNNLNKEKLSTEVEYISSQIANSLHNLNNISLENYALVSKKVTLSEEAGSEGSSQSGSSEQSSGQENSGTQSGQGSEQSSKSSEDESISITEMQNNSVLKIDIEDVDWDTIKKDIENINTAWSIVMLDLYNANVSDDEIIAFSNTLNKSIISIKNEDKESALINLTNLYSYIPKFLTTVSVDKHVQNIENTKYYVFTAYSAASQEDWNTVSTNLANAETSFLSLKNDAEYYDKNEFKINKTAVLLKDLQNVISNSDKELFLLKYKNLIESLNTL